MYFKCRYSSHVLKLAKNIVRSYVVKKIVMTSVLLFFFSVHADDEEKQTSLLSRFNHQVSAAFGNGSVSEGDDMEWRTFELRIGSSPASNRRLDFVHYNEGHPFNNHRDGFAIEPMYDVSINKKIKFELGIGPYLSFNTTSRNQTQYDDKNLGILASVAVLYYLNVLENRNLHLRLDYNHVSMRDTHSSDAILVGIGMNFGESEEMSDNSVQIAIMGANFKTNRNKTEAAVGGQLEIKQYVEENFALSVDLIEEGDDELVERSGVAAQAWWVWHAGERWLLSTGAGPYFVRDQLEAHKNKVDSLISLDVQKQLGNPESGTGLLLRFSRIVTDDSTDRDIFAIGIAKKF